MNANLVHFSKCCSTRVVVESLALVVGMGTKIDETA